MLIPDVTAINRVREEVMNKVEKKSQFGEGLLQFWEIWARKKPVVALLLT